GRPVDAVVPERIGARIVEVLKDWDWEQRPAAVVAVPSTTRPQLVGSLAAGIASVGRLEGLGHLDLAPGAAPLRSGGNSAFRVADLWERFAVGAELQARLEQLDGAPILLVDDVISSRWTMTVAARAPPSSRATTPASSRIRRPRSRALVSFEPAFSPTTTKSVFFETEPEALPPRVMIASFAPSRVKPSSPPVTTTVRPSRVFTKP